MGKDNQKTKDVWKEADRIVEEIRKHEPVFGEYCVSVLQFGAVSLTEDENGQKKELQNSDRETGIVLNNTKAFYKAICHVSEHAPMGGTVVVPPGDYLVGPLHLKSHVNLHLKEGAVLRFAKDTKLYQGRVLEELYGVRHVRTRFEGVELMNYSPFIYAYGETDIAITGQGTLDGQADKAVWHSWKQKKDWSGDGTKRIRPQDAARVKLFLQGEQGVPTEKRIYGEASGRPGTCEDGYLRPSFVQPYACRRILIEGIRILASPMWEIHPVLCEQVIVRNVRIDTHLSNNDGIDPECCKDVLIEECCIDVGDDCIAIKSGRNEDARRIGAATERVVIQNNTFRDGHGGVTIGSELTGGVRNVYVRDNLMESPNLWSAFRFKTNDIRGGVIEHCYYKNNRIKQLQDGKKPVLIETEYEIVTERAIFTEHNVVYREETPVIRDIRMEGFGKEEEICELQFIP